MFNVRRCLLAVGLILAAAGVLPGQKAMPAQREWIALFDGRSLKGWKEAAFSGRGKVEVKDGFILIGSGHMTGITWTGDFPNSDYEVRFEAVRVEGNDFFAGITFPVKDTFCSWINGGWGGSVVGLSNLDDDDASENNTSTVRVFEKGRWYAFRLAVTEGRIQGWIDEVLVIDADIRERKVGIRFGEEELNTPLGFATYSTVAGLRKIEYRKLPHGSVK